jgi:hypothetical protein
MFVAAAMAAPFVASAAAPTLEETAKIPSPDPQYGWPIEVAIDGDWMIASGQKLDGARIDNSTWLYQRQSNGTWTLVRKLHQLFFEERQEEVEPPPLQLAIQGGVAVIVKGDVSAIFERTAASWVQVPSPIVTNGNDVEMNGGTIVVTSGRCEFSSNAYRKGTNSAWTLVRSTPPEPNPDPICGYSDDGEVDVASNGTTTIVSTNGPRDWAPTTARIFEGAFGTTPVVTRLTSPNPEIGIGYAVAIENNSAIATGFGLAQGGTQAYTRSSIGNWVHSGPLLRPDYLDVGGPVHLELSGPLAVMPAPSDSLHGRATGSVGIFERNADGTYRYAARLVASDRGADHAFGEQAEISGRRVVVRHHEGSSANGAAYIYELPSTLTQPSPMQDNFEDGNASDWAPVAGSTFVVATTGTSRVYRQSNSTGNAASLWNNTDRKNQSIEADIKPTAFASTTGDKWFGLVTRYSDANNYYYVTLRNNNTVLLRRMVNGVFTTLASASLPITLNRSYRVRLETIGTRLRVFVDSNLLAEASDNTLAQGQAGVMMFRTRADYDNILVSSNPQTRLVIYLSPIAQSQWLWETTGRWEGLGPTYDQLDVTGGARGITGITTDDQVVHIRMRKTSSSGTNNWFGVATRYRDEGNYYYVTLRNNNTVSLRKLVNGAIVELDSAPLAIAADTWYRVRFEAVGNYLRVYINDVPMLDAVDSSHPTGRYGPVMYRTATQHADLLAVEP